MALTTGPFGDLPEVPGVDGAEDQTVRRKAFEAAGWRIWEDSRHVWHGELGEECAGEDSNLRVGCLVYSQVRSPLRHRRMV